MPSNPVSKKRALEKRNKESGERHYVYFDAWSERRIIEFLSNNATQRGSLNRSALVRMALQRFFKEEERYWPLLFVRLDKLTALVGAYNNRVRLLINVVMHSIAYNFL